MRLRASKPKYLANKDLSQNRRPTPYDRHLGEDKGSTGIRGCNRIYRQPPPDVCVGQCTSSQEQGKSTRPSVPAGSSFALIPAESPSLLLHPVAASGAVGEASPPPPPPPPVLARMTVRMEVRELDADNFEHTASEFHPELNDLDWLAYICL